MTVLWYLDVYLTRWSVCHHNVLLVLLAGHCPEKLLLLANCSPVYCTHCCCNAVAVLLLPVIPHPALSVHLMCTPWSLKTCQDPDWRLFWRQQRTSKTEKQEYHHYFTTLWNILEILPKRSCLAELVQRFYTISWSHYKMKTIFYFY